MQMSFSAASALVFSTLCLRCITWLTILNNIGRNASFEVMVPMAITKMLVLKPRGCSQRKLRTDSCYKDIQSKQAWTSPQNCHPQINRGIYIVYWPFYFHRAGSLREYTCFLTQSVSAVNQVRSRNFYFTEARERPKTAQNAQKWDVRKSTVSKKVREEGIFRKKAAA